MNTMQTAEQGAAASGAAARHLRADAQRNRERLLAVAREVFAEKGVEAPLEEIARRAGVGIGTLYRHFPTRLDLVGAIYLDEVDALVRSAADLSGNGDPLEALRGWLERFVDYVATKRGLAGALEELRKTGAFEQNQVRIHTALGSLLEAGQRAGEIRADVQAPDVVRALGGICMLSERTVPEREQTRRIIELLVDGLRFGAAAAD
ncbi:MAG: TetR/AcrR family transcriptional regulator [Candidatus Dormibacteraeota bacterium]|nr:TetR/AcrR family transcriptional regulator [Candidatus Dormibacteraeota bacterium]MBO0743890.1 TetR/AcrR family transcriptional regulator [Candidatus Dormibacteraeota bacterium]